jgi:hypothetical protein
MVASKRRPKPAPKKNPKLNQVDAKTAAMKAAVLESLTKMPIVASAVKSAGVGRATYYKWRQQDAEFAAHADAAIAEGRRLVNDIALSKLLEHISNGHLTALIWWLKNNHPWFTERILHDHKHEHEHHLIGDGILTPEQKAQIVGALNRSGRFSAQKIHNELVGKFRAELDMDTELDLSLPRDPSEGPPMPLPKGPLVPPQSPPKPKSPPPPKSGGKPPVNLAEFFKRFEGK